MNSEKRTIIRGPTQYDGREGMFLRVSKKVKSSANSEDESEDDLKSIRHITSHRNSIYLEDPQI